MAYYNTTSLTGDELKEAWANAKSQEEMIMVFFRANSKGVFTPFDVLNKIFKDSNTPVTSIRRAMTDLTEANYLIKTDIQRKGDYNKLCHCWRLL